MTELYDLILQMIWSSFVQGRTYTWFGFCSGAIAFCILSLLSYQFRSYDGLVLGGSLLIWFLDYLFALNEYFHGVQHNVCLLTCRNDGRNVCQQIIPAQESKWIDFATDQVKEISIAQAPVTGGAFQTVIADAWQVRVRLVDGYSSCLVYQEQSAAKAFERGKRLAEYFGVPLIFADSQGENPYAAVPLDLHRLRTAEGFPKTIRVRRSPRQWQIDSHWHWSSSGLLLWQMVEQSGFLLFVVIGINVMICVGKVLSVAIASQLGQTPVEVMTLTPFSVFPWLLADFDWMTVTEFAFSLGLMIFKGAELSLEEHLRVTPERLYFSLGARKIAEIPTSEIAATLFIHHPQPMLLILSPNQAVEIPGLQQSIEFRAMLLKLDEALADLRSQNL